MQIDNQLPPDCGYPICVVGTPPAAGNAFTYTVDTRKFLRIMSGSCILTTDANAANRYPYVEILYSAATIYRYYHPVAIPASQTAQISFAPVTEVFAAAFANRDHVIPIPPNFWLDPNCQFRIGAQDMQAGDTLTGIRIFCMRHWDIGI